MDVTYALSAQQVQVQILNPWILKSDKRGGYLFHSFSQHASRYEGLHIAKQTRDGWTLFKTLHNFLEKNPEKIVSYAYKTIISYSTYTVNVTYDAQQIHMDVEKFAENETVQLPIILDCRQIYDFRTTGRMYTIAYDSLKQVYLISYKKKNETLTADEQFEHEPYELYVAIKTDGIFTQNQTWSEFFFQFEHERNSQPDKQWLFHACTIQNPTTVSIGCAFNAEQAIERCLNICENSTYIQKSSQQYAQALLKNTPSSINPSISQGLHACILSLDSLLCTIAKTKGLYAGLPWFFQFWTRDEAISTIGLIENEQYEDAKQILLRQISQISTNGRNPNRYPHADLQSADGIGWTAKRINDLLARSPNTFSHKELTTIYHALYESLTNQHAHFGQNNLIVNKALETWMDTGTPYDVRSGIRIEIQALQLAQLETINNIAKLLKVEPFPIKERTIKQSIIQVLFKEYLHDGFENELDTTIRPNVFLTYYIYPTLLSKKDWEQTFDRALNALYLDWGGIATIDKQHSLFCPTYTGENNASYHRGDSWYFLNNITALALYKLNKKKYKYYYDKILTSSTTEILQSGAIGAHAEVSDAIKLSSQACFMQAWSLATYIELVQNIFGK